MKTILAPVDFSSVTARVVAQAGELAKAFGGSVELFHSVAPPINVVTYDMPVESFAKEIEFAQEQALKKLAEFKRTLDAQDISCTTKFTQGNAVSAILEEARALPAAFIVMGSHGHGALYELLAGSTTHGVLHRTPCPVVVLPSGGKR
ncbi:MAG: universal stress protein [Opitutaceae bacterium]|nr:universal stress protein [Opitutaceae bacterium]